MRPYVVCHMCTSLDGKILGGRWGKVTGYLNQAALFETTAASFGIGAWLVGTTTMDEFDGRKMKLPRAPKDFVRRDFIGDRKAKRFGIGTDTKGVLRFQHNDIQGDHAVVLVTERVSNDYLAHLQAAKVSYFICGKKAIDLPLALRKLRTALKLRKLMLQGGGTFNGSVLQAGLVDEISHITAPFADGGSGIPTMFDAPGPAPRMAAARLRLFWHKVLPGGALWARYKVVDRHIAP